MHTFRGIRKTLRHTQVNNATPDRVFPLLCPVREKEWLQHWDYSMVHSKSGLAEEGCIFTTPHHGKHPTIWYITEHDPAKLRVAFVRVTPGENVVRIRIQLEPAPEAATYAHIEYEYTGISKDANQYIELQLEKDFTAMMEFWEKAINHYLLTGEMFHGN